MSTAAYNTATNRSVKKVYNNNYRWAAVGRGLSWTAGWARALNAASGCWSAAIWGWWASGNGTHRRHRLGAHYASATWPSTRCPWVTSCRLPGRPRMAGTWAGYRHRLRRRLCCPPATTRMAASNRRRRPPRPPTLGARNCVSIPSSMKGCRCSADCSAGSALCTGSGSPVTAPAAKKKKKIKKMNHLVNRFL